MKLFLFFLFTAQFCIGQNAKIIQGHCSDEQGEPAVFVQVVAFKMEGQNKVILAGAMTDFNGSFELRLGQSVLVDLELTSVLFDTLIFREIDLQENERIDLDSIQLIEREIEIILPENLEYPIRNDRPFVRSVKIKSGDIYRN